MPKRAASTRRRPVTLGIDLGGTGIRLIRMAEDGQVDERPETIPVTDRGQAAVLAQLKAAVRRACGEDGPLAAVGLGVPGFIQRDRGLVVGSPNFPDWRNVPIRRLLQREVTVPLILENDANAAALGEAWLGAGRGGAGVMVMVTLGTGVGGGLVIDGSVLHGRDGIAGEIGHQTIDPNGPTCGCGNTGCVEAYASATGLMANYHRRTGHDPAALSGALLARQAREGDREARAVFGEMGWALGILCANLINLLNPTLIVVGGGLSRAWLLFRPAMSQEIARRAIRPAARGVIIRRARLGPAAGMIGAARAAWQAAAEIGPGRRIRPRNAPPPVRPGMSRRLAG
ncbi:MAG: ROK family protein [Nitrospiria bacterium]